MKLLKRFSGPDEVLLVAITEGVLDTTTLGGLEMGVVWKAFGVLETFVAAKIFANGDVGTVSVFGDVDVA